MNNKESVKEEIQKLRDQRWSCSQATLVGIFRGLKIEEPSEALLKAAVSGLRGGIGGTHDQGSCGALTAAAVALGLLYADDERKATLLTRELYLDFKERFGSVICREILNSEGKKPCTDCCLYAGCKVAEKTNPINE